LTQARLPETLVSLCAEHPAQAKKAAAARPLLREAIRGNVGRLSALLKKEEAAERASDFKYWTPLKKELEKMRLGRKR
ncbi:MAG: hypothetical protein Q7R35_13095, partial [Elusimicrobiota bacterium]|nr:hypothetical protein [Elusimicrobiota bacterium]